jgi:hypothetical protein
VPPGRRPQQPVDTAKLTVHGTFASSVWANVFCVNIDGSVALSNADWAEAVDDFIAALSVSSFYTGCSSVLHVTGVHGSLRQAADLYQEVDRPSSIVGGGSSSANDANDCAVVSWYGAWHYRGGKPRTYLPGLPLTATATVNTLDPTFASTLASRANSLITNVTAQMDGLPNPAALGTVSFASGGLWREPPIFRAYLSAQVHPRIGTQRRRLGPWIA